MEIAASKVKELRDKTGAPMMDCKAALVEAAGDLERAHRILRQKGQAAAVKRSSKTTSEGAVGSYIHAGGRIGVLIEVNCETDFVAKSPDFRKLARELALQVAGYEARWVAREDVPDEVLIQERAVYEAKALEDGKPEQVIPRIVEGQIEAFLKQSCLMEQPYFREPSHTVQQLIAENISRLQENITVRRFSRFNIRET
jgi:elongation factor Ts